MQNPTHKPNSPGSTTTKIRKVVLDLLENHANGIRFNALKREAVELDPSFKPTSVGYMIWNLTKDASLISRTAKDTLALVKFSHGDQEAELKDISKPPIGIKEESFYQPFADWLSGSGDEATEAIARGGTGLKGKWGTPDVVGVYKPKPSGIIEDKFAEEHERLRSLSDLFGVGYVLFNRDDLDDPDFRFLIPPRRFEPDMFYVNALARRLLEIKAAHFDKLFQ